MERWGIVIIEKTWLQKWNLNEISVRLPPSNSIFKRVGMWSWTKIKLFEAVVCSTCGLTTSWSLRLLFMAFKKPMVLSFWNCCGSSVFWVDLKLQLWEEGPFTAKVPPSASTVERLGILQKIVGRKIQVRSQQQLQRNERTKIKLFEAVVCSTCGLTTSWSLRLLFMAFKKPMVLSFWNCCGSSVFWVDLKLQLWGEGPFTAGEKFNSQPRGRQRSPRVQALWKDWASCKRLSAERSK